MTILFVQNLERVFKKHSVILIKSQFK
ncbi:hypothetical protein EMIT0P218_50329 [Pseudomonas sp. IT-P218]